MPLSKRSETVTLTPFDKVNQQFSIARAYSTPCLNLSPANVLELNQLRDTFKEHSHIYFPDIDNGAIGALLGVNTFAFTYPIDVIQGSKKRSFGVKTKLGWTLAGEYELSPKTMNANKPRANHSSTMSAGETLKKNDWTDWFKYSGKKKLRIHYPNRMKTAH